MEKTNVLFLSSNQGGRHWLDIDRETRRVQQALDEGPGGHGLTMHVRPAVRLTDLGPALTELTPTVVHFSGHGVSGGRLILRDQDDKLDGVSVDAMADTIGRSGARLVVLNSCFSQPLADALVAKGVRFVVGTKGRLPDQAATAFAEVLYRSLARGAVLQSAFNYAKDAAELQLKETRDKFRLAAAQGADAAVWRLVPEPDLIDDRSPVQVLLVLDLYRDNQGRLESLDAMLPDRRKKRIRLQLSDMVADFQPLVPGHNPAQIDWQALGDATQELVQRASAALEGNEFPVHYYVAGFAPLPVFAHLGFLLSGWSNHVTVLNWAREDQVWRKLPLGSDPGSANLFKVEGLGPSSPSGGQVAVFASTRGIGGAQGQVARLCARPGRERSWGGVANDR